MKASVMQPNVTKSTLTRPTLTRPKAIIFDWDNTLIDSWQVIFEAINATFDDFGVKRWTLLETKQRVAKSMRDSFPEIFGDEWEQAGEVFYQHFEAIHIERLTPYPWAGDALAYLSDAGVYLSVVSNKTGKFLRAEAIELGWDHLFGHIIGAGDAENDKPSMDPVTMALNGSGIANGLDVWFAGDAVIDMQCAFNSGCQGVLIRETSPRIDEFCDYEPIHHFSTVQKLSNHVKTM